LTNCTQINADITGSIQNQGGALLQQTRRNGRDIHGDVGLIKLKGRVQTRIFKKQKKAKSNQRQKCEIVIDCLGIKEKYWFAAKTGALNQRQHFCIMIDAWKAMIAAFQAKERTKDE
jgi:sulfatase maturation enzyme AslB (radical SAM superfamily)